MNPSVTHLQKMRDYFSQHHTYSYDFRKKQLLALRDGISRFEKELHDGLYTDLKKSTEESWVTETGFVMAEISHALKNLKKWMKPEAVSTNLLNLPGKSFVMKEP